MQLLLYNTLPTATGDAITGIDKMPKFLGRRIFVFIVATLLSVICAEITKVKQDMEVEERAEMETVGVLFFNSTNITEMAYGFVANVAAVVLYGSNFVPIKRIETGDGTITVVPIVKGIGIGLGVLIWGSSSLLMGWASSRFGWFGIDAHDVARPILNYCGVGLCLLSGLIFFFVKTDVATRPSSESTPLLDRRGNSGGYGSSELWIEVMERKTKHLIGCLLAVTSGILYGACFIPVFYIKSHASCRDSMFHGASLYDIDYVYAQCCGIFLTITVYFLIYCVVMKSRTRLYYRAILPGFLCGFMWALGTYCWFLANNYLSAVVTFPMVTAGYGLVAGLWGSLVFREVRGLWNSFIFIIATCVCLTGSVLTGFSKL